MSVMNQPTTLEPEQDVFYVELPYGLPDRRLMVINEIDYPIIALQQLVIDDLQEALAQRQVPADTKLKALYDAILAEREEILGARDRAYAETDFIRSDRAKYIEKNKELVSENESLVNARNKLKAEIERLTTDLRHAQSELAGVPTRIENSIKTALAKHGGADKGVVENLERKLSEKADSNTNLRQQLEQEKAKSRDFQTIIESHAKLDEAVEIALDDAEAKWASVMSYVSDVTGWAALLTHENEQLKNDNLLHALMLDYEQLKTVYENEEWKAIVLCGPSQLTAANGDEKPSNDYAVCFCVNEDKGCGHFVYLSEDGELVLPKSTPESVRIPEEFRADLKAGLLDANLKQFNDVVERTANRARTIIHYARLLDIDWSKAPGLVEVSTQLKKHLPKSDITKIAEAIERGRLLVPKTNAHIDVINKRYGTDFPHIQTARPAKRGSSSSRRKHRK